MSRFHPQPVIAAGDTQDQRNGAIGAVCGMAAFGVRPVKAAVVINRRGVLK